MGRLEKSKGVGKAQSQGDHRSPIQLARPAPVYSTIWFPSLAK